MVASLQDVLDFGGLGDDSASPGGIILEFLVGENPGNWEQYCSKLGNAGVLSLTCWECWLVEFWEFLVS